MLTNKHKYVIINEIVKYKKMRKKINENLATIVLAVGGLTQVALLSFVAAVLLSPSEISTILPQGDISAVESGDETSSQVSSMTNIILPTENKMSEPRVMSFSVPEQAAPAILAREKRVDQTIVDNDSTSYPLQLYSTMALPNDPNASQWWVNNIRLSDAWDLGSGSNQTLLAIIDTGFALNHEELRDRWYTNPSETGTSASQNSSILNCSARSLALNMSCNNIDDDLDGIMDNEVGYTERENPSLMNCSDRGLLIDKSCNLIDDDGNGLMDDHRGWDFASNYPSPQAGKSNSNGETTAHGTLVAGVAAATGNNGVGIAGVNWSTKILPLQALDDDGYGDSITVSRAIRYAADQGSDVISISLGTYAPDSFMRQAVAYAISRGSIVVAAAGNDGCDCMVYPARYEEVFAVGASNSANMRSSFSSYGPSLDVIAPGEGMRSTSWNATNQISAYNNYVSGTSFATPLVAGLLTAMRGHQPNATASQLTSALTEQVNRLTLTANVVRSDIVGFGRVDALSAILRATAPRSPSMEYSFYPISGGTQLGNYEPVSRFSVVQCAPARVGTTTVYKLTKGQNIAYTISQVERYKAIATGYSAAISGSSFCMDLPTDNPSNLRILSIPYEFENRAVVKY